ncbi:hypothetical protein SAMN06264855_11111 [Halorubrum vacuolatum]|uniref:Flagellin N-terminal-like domain-containing protein n=1 Tax=Halorubrum vacuolatum TaxID=63740 RepID=A0A238WXG0_HALVU|nr:hypothetical protein SAMN06264855_11111 [Halorubrum vacuolatum]
MNGSGRNDSSGFTSIRTDPGTTGESRAVSETLGFVLVFALVTTTIAVTFTFGLGGLEDAQLAERDTNVERAFDVMHDNLRDISRDGVPSRATEIRLAGGTLTLEERTEIRFNGTGWAEDGEYVERTRPIVYRGAGDSAVAYENGAVLVTDGDHGTVLNGPDLLVNDDGIIVSVIRIGGVSRSIAGDRTVLVVGSNADREVVDRPRDTEEVTMEIDSPRASVWERHYEELAAEHSQIRLDDGDTPECEGDGDVTVCFEPGSDAEFLIHQTTIRIEFTD